VELVQFRTSENITNNLRGANTETFHVRLLGKVESSVVETIASDSPAGSPLADALRPGPNVSASVAVTVTSGESESLYCTDWLPPPSEFVTTGSASTVKSLWFNRNHALEWQ
jgi:hypothetical protein